MIVFNLLCVDRITRNLYKKRKCSITCIDLINLLLLEGGRNDFQPVTLVLSLKIKKVLNHHKFPENY